MWIRAVESIGSKFEAQKHFETEKKIPHQGRKGRVFLKLGEQETLTGSNGN